jgi:gliding motility-associated-like protein
VDGCDDGQIDVTFGAGVVYPVNYELIDLSSGAIEDFGSIDGSQIPYQIQNVPFGTYNLEAEFSGCFNIDTGIVVSQAPATSVDILTEYINCQSTVIINPDPSAIYVDQRYIWNGPNLVNEPLPVLETSVPGSYTVTAEDINGVNCPVTENFDVIMQENPLVQIDINGDGCGTSVLLNAAIANPAPGTNYSYLWTDGTVGGVNELPAPTTGEFIDYQNLSVVVVNQQTGCEGNDGPIDVRTYLEYSVFLTSTIACDDGSPITLTANILNISASNIDTYDWTGPEPGLGNLNTQAVIVNNEGTYEVITTWGVCLETANLNVAKAPVTDANIDPLYQICSEPPANEVVQLEPGDFVSYTLINETTGQIQIPIDPGIYELYEEGIYNGLGINSFGCQTADTFALEIVCVPLIYAPTAFSPASTIPKNRSFSINGAYLGDKFEIIIFNKWGEPVFESQDKNFEWDGTRLGEPLPNGTFAYVMKYTSITDADPTIYEKRGGVTLIR